jgi:hypothetical protein
MNNPTVLKTGVARATYYYPEDISLEKRDISSEAPLLSEAQIIKLVKLCPNILKKGETYSCVFDGQDTYWVDKEYEEIDPFFNSSHFKDIEINETANDEWKKSRTEDLIKSLSKEDLELLKEHLK